MTFFNKALPFPEWLKRQHLNKNTQRGQRYYTHLWNAQPPWAESSLIRDLYRRARCMRMDGQAVEVDHIIPLIHPLVCGLHVRDNLRIIARDVNQKKSNNTFPGMPYEQRDLFARWIAPHDFELTGNTVAACDPRVPASVRR